MESKGEGGNFSGILRVGSFIRPLSISDSGPAEPPSPQPSVDRLSVSFAPDDKSWSFDVESDISHTELNPHIQPSKLNPRKMISPPDSGGDGQGQGPGSGNRLSAALTDEDDDYSSSMNAIINRRASQRKIKGVGKRRTSSPLDSDRRRSSVFTTSSGDTAITMDEGGQEQIFEQLKLHKEVLESVKQQPWEMRRKLKLVQTAKAYVKRHEGQLQERLAQSKSTRDMMARFNIVVIRFWQYLKREGYNLATNMVPWESRIKQIESHFGSVVASYFTFLRWVFWINIVIAAILICFVIVPEILAADPSKAGQRKTLLPNEEKTSTYLKTIWDFEGIMKYSPMFYGFYTDQKKTKEGFPLPLSYFMTGLAVYVYSFVAILRRMAANSRQSKLSEKEDECIFSWKVFTAWDYMIGNPETAFNRFASITMGFKEALLEEKEKKKDERNWKVIGLRVLANFLILLLLMASAYAVILVVQRSANIDEHSSWWRQNEITLAMSLITTIFPNIFELIGMLEKYHPRKQLRWQLARIMALNFLNLYTLIFALFGKVSTMTDELQALKANVTASAALPPLIYAPCYDFSVNCTLLNEFAFYEANQDNKAELTFRANLTTFFPDMSEYYNTSLSSWNANSSAKVNISEWWQLLHNISPKSEVTLGQILNLTLNTRPEFSESFSEILENENSTFWVNSSDLNLNETYLWGNNGTKNSYAMALPIVLKIIEAYKTSVLPSLMNGKLNHPQAPQLPLPLPPSSSSPLSLNLSFPGNKNFSRLILKRPRKPSWRINPTSEYSNDAPIPIDYENGDENGDNNLLIGNSKNRNPTGDSKSSTRGDIPFIPIEETTTTTLAPTTEAPKEELDKFLTRILTEMTLNFIYNSTKFDDAEITKMKEFSKWITTLTSDIETKKVPPGSYLNGTTFGTVFQIKKEDRETKRCYITVCENSTTVPHNLSSYFNCSQDLICSLTYLLGPRNDSCWIPNSRICPSPPTPPPTIDPNISIKLSKLCWETMFGQELVKLTVMDLIFTVGFIFVLDFFRAIFVRVFNPCWCWDMEKQFPQYGDFKIAENILHLVNNQGMVWMGMFFSPGLPTINLAKLVILMYIRSWAVMTCNVPHETVFRASRSNNFYFALLLFMLFLCTLPVGYAIVWLEPSWHCGPFSDYHRIFHIFTGALMEALPTSTHMAVEYIASPGIVIPLLVLLILIIYYLLSLTGALREANNDLKIQLRRERTEERRKMFKLAGSKKESKPLDRWKMIIPIAKAISKPEDGKKEGGGGGEKKTPFGIDKKTSFAAKLAEAAKKSGLKTKKEDDEGSATDNDQVSLPEDIQVSQRRKGKSMTKMRMKEKDKGRKPSCTDSGGSIRSEIPLIKIIKDEESGGGGGERGGKSQKKVDPAKKEKILKALINKSKAKKEDRSWMEMKEEKAVEAIKTNLPIEVHTKGKERIKESESPPPTSSTHSNQTQLQTQRVLQMKREERKSKEKVATFEELPNFSEKIENLESESMLVEEALAEVVEVGEEEGENGNENDVKLISIEELTTDVRPFFVLFQTGFK